MAARGNSGTVVALVLCLLGAPNTVSASVPNGSQFQVNTYTTNNQLAPSIASQGAGNFVVVWHSYGSSGADASGASIQGERYDASGAPIGGEFQVNTYTTNGQYNASVASDGAGNFVVVWDSLGSAGGDTSFSSVQGQRYNASGALIGAQFQVNTYTTNYQRLPSVASDTAGNFVVVWQSYGSAGSDASGYSVQGRRYNASGAPVGAQFQVNTYTTDAQVRPSVASDPAGNFVVVWDSYGSAGSDTSYRSVQGQRYNASGAAVGGQFQVNTYTTDNQREPSVASDGAGNFVVVWASYGSAETDTSAYSVEGRRYSASGAAQGAQFQVNSYTTAKQRRPSVATDGAGHFVVAWQSYGSAGNDASGYSVQRQVYDASGVPIGGELQVNTFTTNDQSSPAVASDATGNFVVAWESNGSAAADLSGYSVQGQRFSPNPTPVGSEFQVNTYTTNRQSAPSVASDAAGNFVVVWQSEGSAGSDISNTSIQAQRYNASGVPLAGQFQVNNYTTSYQRSPSVASDSAGNFVVVWESNGSAGSDTSNESIQAQRYNASGTPLGLQFQVNTYTTDPQLSPSVARDAAGDFVVVWQSFGSAGGDTSGSSVQGQRYDAIGGPQGGQFQINTYTTGFQSHAAVASDATGDFVVVWTSEGSAGNDTSGNSVQGQRYDASGAPVGAQFQVDTYTTSDQRNPSVTSDASGKFVVVWESAGSAGGDTSFQSVQGQRYDASGAAQGGQFQVNTYTTNQQSLPSVASDASGDFVVVWQSLGSAGSDTSGYSLHSRIYDRNGAPIGGQFQINTYTTSNQDRPSVASSSDGKNFVVVWRGYASAGSDTSFSSVQGQRYLPEPSFAPSSGAMLAMLLALARRRRTSH